MAKRMMDLNPNSFRKLVATFLEANGRVSLSFFPFASRPSLFSPREEKTARSRPPRPPPPKTNNDEQQTKQGYWEADEEKIERLKQMYNEVEDKIEGVE